MSDLDNLKPHIAKANLAFYASEYLTGPPEAPFKGRFMIVDHHEQWAALVNKHRMMCINAARGHGKSHFFTLAYPIWMADKHPGSQGFIFSGSQPQADMILARIIHEIELNPKLAHLLPPDKPKRKMWSTKQIRLTNGSEIYARGYGTKVRGVHPNWIVCDDILNDNDAHSPTVREKNIGYFLEAVRPTLRPSGQIIVIGTPFHETDLYGYLRGNSEYHFSEFPALIGPEGGTKKPLWPEYFPQKVLDKMRNEMGGIRFAREMLCNPKSDEASLFPLTLFNAPNVKQPMTKLGADRKYWKEKVGITSIYMGVDFALSTNVGADYTVIWVMGVNDYGERWVIDIVRDRGMGFNTQKNLIIETARKYRPIIIFCESNQSQRIFGDDLIRTTDLPIKHFHTGENKHSLEDGVPSLRVLLENGKVRIPTGDLQSIERTNIWIDEMRAMSFAQGKVFSSGAHDDTVMAFWICNEAVATGNFGFSFNEKEGDAEAFVESQMLDEEAEDELEDQAFVVGVPASRQGAPRWVNARLVGEDELDDDSELVFDKRPKELRPYAEVMPRMGIPTFGRHR